MKQVLHFEPTVADVNPESRQSVQVRFDPLDYEDSLEVEPRVAAKMALAARNRVLREARKLWPSHKFTGVVLQGQLRQYRSFGVPDGRYRSIYYIMLHRTDA